VNAIAQHIDQVGLGLAEYEVELGKERVGIAGGFFGFMGQDVRP
jgi:hypothetical protein